MLRQLVGYTFADLPVEVHYVATVDEMEQQCRCMPFDLVVVLRTSPFLCGPDLVRRVRPEGMRRPEVYVVSWLQTEQTVLSLLECGVDQYMTFPVNLGRLRSKVTATLNRVLK